jgi:hypothetical protein
LLIQAFINAAINKKTYPEPTFLRLCAIDAHAVFIQDKKLSFGDLAIPLTKNIFITTRYWSQRASFNPAFHNILIFSMLFTLRF